MRFEKIAFVASRSDDAQKALKLLSHKHGQHKPEDADVIVALGGDGFCLHRLHKAMVRGQPLYGMNRGSVGFLMNSFSNDDLIERLEKAEPIELHPLRMRVEDLNGEQHEALALNEVSLLRETRLAAKIQIKIDGVLRLDELICDGVMVATPAGSTAYNLSAHGPIVPMGSGVLALTPISAYRPRRWRGALLPDKATAEFIIQNPDDRRVSATADFTEVRHVRRVTVCSDPSVQATLLFDPEHNLEERIIKEQFLP